MTPEQTNFETVPLTDAEVLEMLGQWYHLQGQLSEVKAKEMELRNKIVQAYFPDGLKEGVNSRDMPEGWVLKATGSVNRKIEQASILAVSEELKEHYGIDAGEYIKYKPELDLPAYRGMVKAVDSSSGKTQEVNKKILKTFEQLLIISDGSPQVELVKPKRPKAKVVAK